MAIGEKKELDNYGDQLLRKAEAVQLRLDEVTRAAHEELTRIRDEIHAIDSIRELPEKDGKREAHITNRKTVAVTKNINTVLIVEKHPNYSQLLANQIRSAGFQPVVAITAEGGLRKAEEHHPDVSLLGLELPDRDGLRFVSEIRRNREADRIPIIAMSALPHLKSRCLELGCDDFLRKPVRMIDLITRIKKILDLKPTVSVLPTS